MSIVDAPTLSLSLNSHGGRFDYETETLVTHALKADGFDASEDGTGRGTPIVATETMPTLRSGVKSNSPGHGARSVAAEMNQVEAATLWNEERRFHDMAVRRLTPLECERLMGQRDGATAVTYRCKPAADGPRYKALGNSMAVNCMRWIGRRIEMVERIAND